MLLQYKERGSKDISSTNLAGSYILSMLSLLSITLLLSSPLSIENWAVAQTGPQATAPLVNYTDPIVGISIQYPSDWQEIRDSLMEGVPPANTKKVIALQPPDQSVDFTIGVETLQPNLTLDQYAQQTVQSVKNNQPNAQVLELNKTLLAGGVPAYKLVVGGIYDVQAVFERSALPPLVGDFMDFQPVNFTGIQYFTIRNNNGYFIVYSDLSGKIAEQVSGTFGPLFPDSNLAPEVDVPFSHYLPTAQKMIDSFQFTSQDGQINNDNNTSISNGTIQQPTNDDPCSIVNLRLARGEISIEEYERLHETLQC